MKRGSAVQIRGLSRLLYRELSRATQLAGFRSVSEWLFRQTRAFIAEQRRIHGDLMDALTPLEEDILRVVRDGANDPEHIAEETMISARKLGRLLADLVDRGVLEMRRQGGKTDQARGARRPLYFVTEKYQSRSE
jgi:predicted transcriptional regulator